MSAVSSALAITGPTTSGKTALSIAVAERLGGEVISMDSRQVYRGLDIGTDKASLVQRARVRHHGLDLVDPDQRYSAGQFARDADRWIREIRGRGHLPVFAGGTGFFLRAVTNPLFDEPEMDPSRRESLRAVLERWDPAKLGRAVRVLDPERADLALEGGRQRLLRTLEVALLTGRPLSRWHAEQHERGQALPGHSVTIVVLELPRERLDRNIDARVDAMQTRGLLDEVRRLASAGYDEKSPGMSGTGYRELLAVLRGSTTLEDALDQMKMQTRQYARRQLTWFRNQLAKGVVRIDATVAFPEQVDAACAAWMARAA